MKSPQRRMALVANGKAGALMGAPGTANPLEAALREAAASLEVIDTAGSLPERMERALRTGADVVVVAGGDGSIACAAGVLAGTDAALGVIPCGTMNLLGRDLGLDPDDRAACVRVLADGERRSIDAGQVSAGGEDHLFLCASMLGTPARLTRYREAGRKRGGGWRAWAGFGRAVAAAMVRNRSMRLTLRLDGRVLQRRTPSLTVVVNALDDASGRMFGRTDLDGGRLVLYIVPRAGMWRQLWRMLRAAVTGTLQAAEIETIETDRVEIESQVRAMHVLVDGELRLLAPPLRYEIRAHAVQVIAPARRQAA